MSFVRKYWVAGLVILLVAIHAMIIGYVRSEATRLKTVASSEIPLGLFYKQSTDRQWLTQLRVHLQVPPERRLAARATVEHNRWLVHEAVEEALRRLDEKLLLDPSLVVVKDEIKQAIDQVLHEEIVERIVVNDRIDLEVREFHFRPSQELITPGEEGQASKSTTLTSVRPVRKTLSEQNSDNVPSGSDEGDEHSEDEAHSSDESGHESGHETPHESGKSAHGSDASDHSSAKTSSHSTPKQSAHSTAKATAHSTKKSSSHSTTKKSKAAH
jgi:hypothetical protein